MPKPLYQLDEKRFKVKLKCSIKHYFKQKLI